jgi:hypothetical protein
VSGLSIRAAWQPLDREHAEALIATLGVYEIADAAGRTLMIGYAGGRSRFGLRSVITQLIGGKGTQFRVEYNMQYISRWKELLMYSRLTTGALPPLNSGDDGFRLGRLGPVRGART